jgi:hypothetical protein
MQPLPAEKSPAIGPEKLFDLVLARIYHEDRLLLDRTRNWLTLNAFVAAGLALAPKDGFGQFFMPVVISALMSAIAVLQASIGRRCERAISFWRAYAAEIERDLGIRLDSALTDYYKYPDGGKAPISGSKAFVFAAANPERRMHNVLPWKLGMPSTNDLIGVVIPWLFALFWATVLAYKLSEQFAFAWIYVGTVMLVLMVVSRLTGPSRMRDQGELLGPTLTRSSEEHRS